MKNKDTLFSKVNNNIELESVIEEKGFSDEAKSLVLNIAYKIDNAYRDYSKIKFNAKTKENIISDIAHLINKYCNKIEVVDPKVIKQKYIIKRDSKEIDVFPSEINLLQAIYLISTTEKQNSKNLLESIFCKFINNAKSIDGSEIIRDFNGWSWTSAIENNKDRLENLIYQDLLILIGRDAVIEIEKSQNKRYCLQEKIKEIYGERKACELAKKIDTCLILSYIQEQKNGEKNISNYSNILEKRLKLIENKPKYIGIITTKNNELMKKVSKIGKIISRKKLLEKAYMKPGISQKYNILENYRNYLIGVQGKYLKKIEKNSQKINPFEYVKNKKIINDDINVIKNAIKANSKTKSLYESIIELQRSVLACFNRKTEMYDLRKDLMNLVYEIRYYNYIPVIDSFKIIDIKELNSDIKNVQRKIINKLIEAKAVERFSSNNNTNYLIMEHIFITKSVSYGKIFVKLDYKDKKLVIEYYDENDLENKVEIKLSKDEFCEMLKKTNKKIKIFI